MSRFCSSLTFRRFAAQTCRRSATKARHPRFRGIQEGPVKESFNDLVTEDLLAEVQSEPVGIWSLKTFTGYLLISHSGPKPRTFRITVNFRRIAQLTLSSMLGTHHIAATACSLVAASAPAAPTEGAPTLTGELRRVGCAGFFRKARKQSA